LDRSLETPGQDSRPVIPSGWITEEWLWGREQQSQYFAKGSTF